MNHHHNYSQTAWIKVTFTQEHLCVDTAFNDRFHPQGRVDIPWSNIARINKSRKDLTKLTFAPNLLTHSSNRILKYSKNQLYLPLDYEKFIDDLLDARMVVQIKYGAFYRKSGYKPRGAQWFKDRGEFVPPPEDPMEDWSCGQVYESIEEPTGGWNQFGGRCKEKSYLRGKWKRITQ